MKLKYLIAVFPLVAGLAVATPALPKAIDGLADQSNRAAAVETQQTWFFYTCSYTYKETIGSYGGVGGGGGGTMTRTRTGYYPSLIACPV